MATVSIDGDTLDISVEGLDTLWTLKCHLSIPLAHVRGATADAGIVGEPKGWRGPGTHLPGVLVAGTFHQDGERVFWDVHNPSDTIVIELADDTYRRLVIDVDNPRATVELIERALARR
jgi:hypothetical protein